MFIRLGVVAINADLIQQVRIVSGDWDNPVSVQVSFQHGGTVNVTDEQQVKELLGAIGHFANEEKKDA